MPLAPGLFPHDPNIKTFVITTPVNKTSIEAALLRAAFLLRKEGNGGYDNEQAAVLESITVNIKE